MNLEITNYNENLRMNLKLLNYQQDMREYIYHNPKSFCMVPLGLGKTAATLMAISDLLINGYVKGVLIMAPLQVIKLTWPLEIEKWSQLNWLKYEILHGPPKTRLERLNKDAHLYLINYEGWLWLDGIIKKNHKNKWPFDMVVFDESSKMKSPSSKRFKKYKKYVPYMKQTVLLTGTPRPKTSLDLWSQTFLLDGGERLDTAYTRFQNQYAFPVDYNRYIWKEKKDSEYKIYDKIKDLVFKVKDEYLPEKIPAYYEDIRVELGEKLQKEYKKLEKDGVQKFLEEPSATAATTLGKCAQFASGAIYDEDGVWHRIHDIKIQALIKLLKQPHMIVRKTIIVYNYLHDRDRILEKLSHVVLMNAKNSEECMERWNDGMIARLLVHPASVGHGVNLQYGGYTLVWFGPQWNWEYEYQMNHRIIRKGQTETVEIYRIVMDGTIEMVMCEVLRHRENGSNKMYEIMERYLHG